MIVRVQSLLQTAAAAQETLRDADVGAQLAGATTLKDIKTYNFFFFFLAVTM